MRTWNLQFKAMPGLARWCVASALLGVLALSSGCATAPGGNPRDPFESFNRGVTRFNDAADRLVLKPVATGYVQVVPALVRAGVGNFFRNLTEPWTFVNSVLQLKPQAAGETLIRFTVNTFFGLGGILDIASEAGIEKYNEDFGLTLGRWGVGTGPYVVLPILGSSNVRDGLAFSIESTGNPLRGIDNRGTRNVLYALGAVDTRAKFLGAGTVLEEAALDKYTFSRDAYLQRRRNLVMPNPEDDYVYEPDPVPAVGTEPANKGTKDGKK